MSSAAVDHFASVPWVRRIPPREMCQGTVWSRVSGRHPRGSPRPSCKLWAHWHYTALRGKGNFWRDGPPGKTGDYCWHHLLVCIFDYPRERQRYEEWKKAANE